MIGFGRASAHLRALIVGMGSLVALGYPAQPALPQDATPSPTADAPSEAWIIRGLPEFSSATRIRLAQEGRPSWHKIEADDVSLRRLLDAVCGTQDQATTDFLMQQALDLNLIEDADTPIARGDVVALPFCMNVRRNVLVTVQQGQNASTVLDDVYGISGPKTIRQTYALNRGDRYRTFADFENNLRVGDEITVPFASEKVYFLASDGAATDPLNIVRDLEPPGVVQQAELVFSQMPAELESHAAGPPAPPSLASPASGVVELVSAVEMDPAREAQACGKPSTMPFHPFDIAEVRQAYDRSSGLRNARGFADNGPSRVGLIDTGLAGFGDDFFAERFFFANDRELRGKAGVNDDAEGPAFDFVDDVYGANIDKSGDFSPPRDPTFRGRAHGTQMGSLILGGRDGIASWPSNGAPPPIQIKAFNFAQSLPNAPTKMADADRLGTAIDYLADAGVQTISLSLATTYSLLGLRNVISRYNDNVLFIVAAGNGRPGHAPVGVDLLLNQTIVPANYGGHRHLANVITVGAYGYHNSRAAFSNFSSENVDFLAPGCGIEVRSLEAGFVRISGTSPAAAITAFGAALVRAVAPRNAKVLDIRNRLVIGTDYEPALDGAAFMPGKLNLVKALSLYQDLIELRGANPQPYIYGRIASRRHFLAACPGVDSSGIFDEEIVKIVPNVTAPGEPTKLIVWLKRSDGIDSFECLQSTDPQASSWRLGTIDVSGSSQDVPRLDDIKEIIFSSY